jgi:hypothetical protein
VCLVQVVHEVGAELGAFICDSVLWESMLAPDMFDKELADSRGINIVPTFHEVCHFGEVVNNYKDGIVAVVLRHPSNEVIGDGLPWPCGYTKWLEWCMQDFSFWLCSLTEVTSTSVVLDILFEGLPVEFPGDKFCCFLNAIMSSSEAVVAASQDLVFQLIIIWDIDEAAISEECLRLY